MRVCFMTNASELGGAERVLLETVDAVKDRGVECRVILPRQGELSREFDKLRVPYALLDGGSWVSWREPSFWARGKAAAKIAYRLLPAIHVIRRWSCDAVYSNALTVCGGALAAQTLNLPHIWHLHEFGKEDHGLFYKFGENVSNRAIGRMSSTCIVVSNALAAKYRGFVAPSKLKVLYPSMHWDRKNEPSGVQAMPAPAPSGRLRLVIVGGLVEGKRQEDAVVALDHLRRDCVDAELSIVGEGYPPYRNTIMSVVQSRSLQDRVQLIGRVPDATPFIRSADIVLVCSKSEAFGRTTIEAMLAGKPVVGAAAGATMELVQNGFSGLLYTCGDAVDLAAKIRLLSEHPTLRIQCGENGRRWARVRFTKERYGEELMSLLSSAIAPGKEACQDLVSLTTH